MRLRKWWKKYIFLWTKKWQESKNKYIEYSKQNKKDFLNKKKIFEKDIFNSRLETHSISNPINWITPYTTKINNSDRVIFFLDWNIVFLYTILSDHNYKRLKNNIQTIVNMYKEKVIDKYKEIKWIQD